MGQWTDPNSEWFCTVYNCSEQIKKTCLDAAVLSPTPGKIAVVPYLSPFNSHIFSLLSVCEFEVIRNIFNCKLPVLYLYQSAAYGAPKLLTCILWGFGTKGANHTHGWEPARRMAVNVITPTHGTCTICHSAGHKRHFQWTRSIQHCMEMQI